MRIPFLILSVVLVVPVEAQTPVDIARAHREAHGAAILAEYAELLRIPNVASDIPNIRRNAEWIRSAFGKRGVTLEILALPASQAGAEDPASIPPVIHGRLDAGADRTLGIYVHYDGQPVSPAEWAQSPWEPTLYSRALLDGGTPIPMPKTGEPIDPEARIYARAAGDDKAPIPCLLAAMDALQAANRRPSSNLVFFFEGEEEAGSPHLGAYMDTYADRLQVDAWLICDGPVHQSRQPQLVFGVRGITALDITLYGATRGLHSGHYGNWAPNPAQLLAELLASMKDADGNVLVEGYYDSADPLGEAERAALATVPEVDEQLRREWGIGWTEGGGQPLTERLLLPSLNVRGLSSANVGTDARNVIPPTATAALDLRLVKGNDPVRMQELVEAHIERQGYTIVREDPDLETRRKHERIAKVTRREGYPAARTSMDHPIVAPLTRAAELAAGGPVIRMPSLGGSLPLYLFNEKLGSTVVIVPVANHDDNQHAANENLRIANLWYGIDLMASILAME